jgi:hypothetical protein
MAGLGIEVKGFEELKRKIILLSSDKDKKQEMLLILRQIARPTLDASKVLAPIGRGSLNRASGSLKASLGFITGKKGNAKNNPTVYVGPKVHKGKKGEKSGRNAFGDGWYGAMVSAGHNIYKTGFKRKRNGQVKYNATGAKSRTKSNPYLQTAFSSTASGATADAEKRMANFMQRRINKLK